MADHFTEGERERSMSEPTTDDREALLKVLAEQGLSEPAFSPHSWRCEHPDRYPDYCTCARDMADAILAAGFTRTKGEA
jgi:hypothetical protein